MSATLRFDHLYKSYSVGQERFEILHDISTVFHQGRSYAITGASGTGKSTCIHLLAGLDAPTAGRVLYNQADMSRFSAHESALLLQKNISLVFQQPFLLQELTVLENVMLKAILHGPCDQDAYDRAYQLLEQVGLHGKAHNYPVQLSGGQQQRIAILRAIFMIPQFLLLDEPTGNLDDQSGQQLMDLLFEYRQTYGMGLIMSTHNLDFAQQMDHLLKVEDKKLVSVDL
jgi:ABC-type lipoprotein export system ATPase subunit